MQNPDKSPQFIDDHCHVTTTTSDGLLSMFHCSLRQQNQHIHLHHDHRDEVKAKPCHQEQLWYPRPWWFDTCPLLVDTSPPVFLSVLTELSLPCLPGLPSVCIFSVLRRKFNICETLAWSLGAIYVTGTEMLHNLLYFGDDTFPMWSKKVTNTIAAHALSFQGRIYIVGLADKHCLFSTNQNQFCNL